MRGGRNEGKWEQLFGILQRENVVLTCLAETHLRDSETPPPNEHFVWMGLNRVKGDRKGGGLGFLSRVGSKWERARATCQEHMWITGYIGDVKVALGLVYLWTGKNSYDRNIEILGCMERDIYELEMPVVVLGDFNAHIEYLDGKTDRAGSFF
ncbi:hypothetical protein HPB52_014702 [Rhipicephalus sanguineus]|uniref:Endonuclease/exonuclease/phosphatase domain-containing protein n=1 Tax=Rhipicephalus sanguineus TaxID=34632 RepID=A0A9D4T7W4_RHISA|nr:hypothetical protein HPB52_014702 [Rhipicephalus sanguineus]